MSKFGINVPEGIPAHSIADVESAAKKLADEKGEVSIISWQQKQSMAACEQGEQQKAGVHGAARLAHAHRNRQAGCN